MLTSFVIAGIVCGFARLLLCRAGLDPAGVGLRLYLQLPPLASSPPGLWAPSSCLNMASPPRSSRSAGQAIVSLLADIGIHDTDAYGAIRPSQNWPWLVVTTVFQPAGLPGLHRAGDLAGDQRLGIGQVQQCHRGHQGVCADRVHHRWRHHSHAELRCLPFKLAAVPFRNRPAKRVNSAGAASCAPRRSSSSPTSASKRSRRPARRRRDRPRTCRSESSARWWSAPSSTSWWSIVLTMIVPYTELNVPDGRGRRRRLRPAVGLAGQDHQGRCDHRPDPRSSWC